jgi:Flp pilus assembly pilin Flp
MTGKNLFSALFGRWRAARGARRAGAGFAADKRGVTAAEFALVVPVCVTLICVFIDIMMVMFITMATEGGLGGGSRYAITGYIEPGKTREQKILEIVQEHTYGLVAPADMALTTKVYPSFADVGKPEPFVDSNGNGQYDSGEPYTDINGNGRWDSDMGTDGPGGPGAVVAYVLTYSWTLWTPFAAEIWGDGGRVTMRATIAVRNEPF